jgi:hypothetical protein
VLLGCSFGSSSSSAMQQLQPQPTKAALRHALAFCVHLVLEEEGGVAVLDDDGDEDVLALSEELGVEDARAFLRQLCELLVQSAAVEDENDRMDMIQSSSGFSHEQASDISKAARALSTKLAPAKEMCDPTPPPPIITLEPVTAAAASASTICEPELTVNDNRNTVLKLRWQRNTLIAAGGRNLPLKELQPSRSDEIWIIARLVDGRAVSFAGTTDIIDGLPESAEQAVMDFQSTTS